MSSSQEASSTAQQKQQLLQQPHFVSPASFDDAASPRITSLSPKSNDDDNDNDNDNDNENDDEFNEDSTNDNNASHISSSSATVPGPGAEDDFYFFRGFANPFVGAAKLVHNTFRYVTGRMTDEEIKAKIKKASKLRENINTSLSRRIGKHVAATPKRVFVGTWNVAKQAPPSTEDMKIWLNGNSTCKPRGVDELPKIAVIGIQEATMSGTAMMLETTEAVAEWSEAFQAALHQLAKDAGHPTRYRKLDGVQLVGLIMLIFLPVDEFPHVRHLRTAVTRTGPLSAVGNKGAVGCRLTFHGKRLLFICGHFAPHEHNVQQRDHHYHSALDRLELTMPESNDDLTDFVLRLNADSSLQDRGANDGNLFPFSLGTSGIRGAGLAERIFHRRDFRKLKNATERSRALLHSHDYCFFFGDLNYRLVRGAGQQMIKELMTGRKIKQLLQYDELYLGLRKGFIFEGFVEPPIRFLPTYKFAPDTDSYDLSKRKPAWTDRVLVHCLNGEVDVDDKMDNLRTDSYLVTSEVMQKARKGSGLAAGATEAAGNDDHDIDEIGTSRNVIFLEVDDSRGPASSMIRANSDDLYSNRSTPQVSPQSMALSLSSFAKKQQHVAGDVSPVNLSPSSFGRNNSSSSDKNSQNPHQFSSTPPSNNSMPSYPPPSCGGGGTSPSNHSIVLSPETLADHHRHNGHDKSFDESFGDENQNQNENNNNDNNNHHHHHHSTYLKNGFTSKHGGDGEGTTKGLTRNSASFEDFLRGLDGSNNLSNTIENKVDVHWYCAVPSLRMSDHRPVSSAFDINVAYLSDEQQKELVFDTKQEFGLDFQDELKYAV